MTASAVLARLADTGAYATDPRVKAAVAHARLYPEDAGPVLGKLVEALARANADLVRELVAAEVRRPRVFLLDDRTLTATERMPPCEAKAGF